ncbi:HEAT repeat domain-containing protein [Nocardia sp. NPDC003999]
MNTGEADTELSSILARSRSSDNAVRIEAIADLGRNIRSSSARERLQEMMVDDEIVTMRVDAAEQLVRTGGDDGLLAVLTELGRRRNDPDIDYTAYMLSELENFGEFPVLRNALAIDRSRLSPDAKIGLSNLRELLNK